MALTEQAAGAGRTYPAIYEDTLAVLNEVIGNVERAFAAAGPAADAESSWALSLLHRAATRLEELSGRPRPGAPLRLEQRTRLAAS